MFLRRPGRPPLAFGGLAFFLLKYGVEDQVDSWVFPPPYRNRASIPKRPLRLTARGFTNLRGGHRRLRLCLSATAVTTERVAEGQAPGVCVA